MQEMTNAHRFLYRMLIFWNIVSLSMVALLTIHAFAVRSLPWPLWRTIAFVVLDLAYAGWYYFGFRWTMRRGRTWQEVNLGRRALYWLPLVVLPLVLTLFDPIFVNLEWIAIGSATGLLLPPWNIAGIGVALFPLLLSWGIWPRTNTATDWLIFATTLLTIIIYCAVIYMPYILITQRFRQARLFADLQTAHADLAKAHAQLAESAAHERELAVLRERERLARDMHDTLGHALVLTTVKLEAIRRLSPIDPDRAAHEVDATEEIVRGAMGELRATLTTLRTVPCLTALQTLAQTTGERTGMHITSACCEASASWPPAVQEALLRVGTEAIANVERHAHARQLSLSVHEEAGVALLRVTDDGIGLPELPTTTAGMPTSPAGHFGLAGMHERVTELGGVLRVVTATDQGTTIEARIPLAPADALPIAALTQAR
jgi:signal transduction histidine kinase